jgi:hypothetical protein
LSSLLLPRSSRAPVAATYQAGAHDLHIECSGSGPTVLFEAAIGGDHALWPIADRLRDYAYACTYDRAGETAIPGR